ncbi:hypothetical protein IV454_04230 [Massilia antarctica]|uniref:Uncharacterized protein n=1 Tax=Massilia antarctica TaxID=2765360 RepID=A0AA49A927_9BURK|nr:hypothetical protein [Massilia antarctica]QPI50791.1 hypothetical protein IV454_04230 [Massilia antarctica]
MRESIIVTDDFYQDPLGVRAFALRQNFSVKGNYPGARTQAFLNPPKLRNLLKKYGE